MNHFRNGATRIHKSYPKSPIQREKLFKLTTIEKKHTWIQKPPEKTIWKRISVDHPHTNQKVKTPIRKEKYIECDLTVIQDQILNWTKRNTYKSWNTPLLKITLFSCFIPSLTCLLPTPHNLFNIKIWYVYTACYFGSHIYKQILITLSTGKKYLILIIWIFF